MKPALRDSGGAGKSASELAGDGADSGSVLTRDRDPSSALLSRPLSDS